MKRVVSAVESGKCVLAVAGSLSRDPDVLLALNDRSALPAMVLSGPVSRPLRQISADAVARSVAAPGGVLVLVEPQAADMQGMKAIAKQLTQASNKPEILVVAKSFNPFEYMAAFPGMKVGHIKGRGKNFVKDLPIPESVPESEVVAVPKTKKAKSGDPNAPRFQFVGREEALETLTGFLSEGGPIVVSGSPGSGRTWLTDAAIEKTEMTKLPDLAFSRGCGFDALIGRLAEIAAQGGDDTLRKLLGGKRTPLQTIETAIQSLKNAAGTENQVMVIQEAHIALGREACFFRKDRLAVLVHALMTSTYPLRLVFISNDQPIFYVHGEADSLRRLEMEPMKGKLLNEIFTAYKAPEFPRDKFGPLNERIHGHPMAARQFAIEIRVRDNGLELLDDGKFLKSDGFEDTDALRRVYRRKVDKLKGDARQALCLAAHFRTPVTGQMLADLGMNRKQRLGLLAQGLLDMCGTENARMYRVHPLVRSCLKLRDISDFDTNAKIMGLCARLASNASGVEKVALTQAHNKAAVGSRNDRRTIKMPFDDSDAVVDTITGMLRSQRPNLKVARILLDKVRNWDPSNSEAQLLHIEHLSRDDAKKDVLEAAFEEAMEKAAIPEVFHQAASFYLSRRSRVKAIAALEKGVALMPNEVRLKTRLGSLLLGQGRRPEAMEMLRSAMDQAPMLPDAYGLLGMAKRDEGPDAQKEAESLLREAVRLAPADPIQIPRLVGLLLAQARVDADRAVALRAESLELLEPITRGNSKSSEGYLLQAIATRESGGDTERCEWLLKQARKTTDKRGDRISRIRVERALLGVVQGNLDQSESTLRDLIAKDMSNARLFMALATILEARQQYIPAHAELLRASERTPPNSLLRREVDAHLGRIQAIIEAQAAGTFVPPPMPQAQSAEPAIADHNRVIRRKKKGSKKGKAAEETPAEEAAAPAEEAAAPAEEAAAPAEEAAAPAEEAAAPAEEAAAPAEEAAAPAEEAAAPAEEAGIDEE